MPKSKCTIAIDASPAAVNAELILRRSRSDVDQRQPLTAQPAIIELEPDDYTVSLRLNSAAAMTEVPMPVSLYDDHSIVFRPAPPTRGGLGPTASALEIGHFGRGYCGAAECDFRNA